MSFWNNVFGLNYRFLLVLYLQSDLELMALVFLHKRISVYAPRARKQLLLACTLLHIHQSHLFHLYMVYLFIY